MSNIKAGPKAEAEYPDTGLLGTDAGCSAETAPLIQPGEDVDSQAQPDEALPGYSEEPPSLDPSIPSDLPPAFSVYNPREITTDQNDHRILTNDAHLNTSPEALYQYLVSQNQIHPYYHARIYGYHHVTTTRWHTTSQGRRERRSDTQREVDFDFEIDLTHMIINTSRGELREEDPNVKAFRGTIFKTKGPPRMGLTYDQTQLVREWVHRYCEDKSYFKTFTLNKEVRGHSESALRQAFTDAVRSTNYVGKVEITFQCKRGKVWVAPDNLLSRWRRTWACKWYTRILVVISLIWVITWPILFFATKKYEAVVSVWPTRDHWELVGDTDEEMERQVGALWERTIRLSCMAGRKCALLGERERDDINAAGYGEENTRRSKPRLGRVIRGMNSGGVFGALSGVALANREWNRPEWGGDESSDW